MVYIAEIRTPARRYVLVGEDAVELASRAIEWLRREGVAVRSSLGDALLARLVHFDGGYSLHLYEGKPSTVVELDI